MTSSDVSSNAFKIVIAAAIPSYTLAIGTGIYNTMIPNRRSASANVTTQGVSPCAW